MIEKKSEYFRSIRGRIFNEVVNSSGSSSPIKYFDEIIESLKELEEENALLKRKNDALKKKMDRHLNETSSVLCGI